MKRLPLSVRDIPPHEEAERLTGTRADGLPEGVHTGGAWLWKDRVYQPLDGRPYANADFHVALPDVVECLEAMAGEPLFPKNWNVEERNGRRFLVRNEALIVTESHLKRFDRERLELIERAVRNLNRRGWEIGDEISLGYDRSIHQMFVVDMSNCHRQAGKVAFAADEEARVRRLWDLAGADNLIGLRRAGKHVLGSYWGMQERGVDVFEYNFAYGSYRRPLSRVWASIPDEVQVVSNWEWPTFPQPYTWLLSREPLDGELLNRYELTLAYERWIHIKEEE